MERRMIMALGIMKRISPEYVLKNAIEDMRLSGLDGLKPYLTSNALKTIDTVLKFSSGVDLFTGAVYAIPRKQQIVHSCGVSLVRIPVYDSPCLVTERSALSLMD